MESTRFATRSRKSRVIASTVAALMVVLFGALEFLIVRSYVDSSRVTNQFATAVDSTTFIANVQRQFYLYQRALMDTPVDKWQGKEVVRLRQFLNRQIDLLGKTRRDENFQDKHAALTYKLISINGLVRDPSLVNKTDKQVKEIVAQRLGAAEVLLKNEFDSQENLLFGSVGEAVRGREKSQRFLVALAGVVFIVVALASAAWSRSTRSKLSTAYNALLSEMDQRKNLEEELTHQAFHDPLTGLANRELFTNDLEKALGRSERDAGSVGILYIDLDNFKAINDTLGHEAGDALLKDVAARLMGSIRPSDTAARLGGDEFAIIIDDLTGVDEAAIVADRILNSFDGTTAFVGTAIQASIGVAVSSESVATVDALIRDADLAMYEAKVSGKNAYRIFDPELKSRVQEETILENELRYAIDNDRLVLHYQPIVSLTDGAAVGFEALVRWNHPTRGFLSPAEFIGLAEERGLIVKLDRWVLNEATRQLARWKSADPAFASTYMSINVSGTHFEDPRLVGHVRKALAASGLAPHDLRLEVTESTLMRDNDAAAATLESLKALGVSLSLDDFGMGYSSLSYLRSFPLDTLKIDRSFVADVAGGPEESALTKAIVRIGHTLKLEVVAEGIENAEQMAALRRLGCHVGQGFLFSKPLPPDAIERLVATIVDVPAAPEDAVGGTQLKKWGRQERRVSIMGIPAQAVV